MADWNSEQYLKFKNQRTQPAFDLLHRVLLENPAEVIDIGCGPGNSTAVLRARYPKANILGIDSSRDMIQAARRDYPELAFQQCDAEVELPQLGQAFDLVFSNACIQWIPNHPKLLGEMLGLLNPGGVLAVQLPLQHEQPVHKIMAEIAKSSHWRDKIPAPRELYILSREGYSDLLTGLTPNVTMWEITYIQRMQSHEAILEWYRGTGLRPYLDALSEEEGNAFTAEVYSRITEIYTPQKNGEILFPFPRLFFLAEK